MSSGGAGCRAGRAGALAAREEVEDGPRGRSAAGGWSACRAWPRSPWARCGGAALTSSSTANSASRSGPTGDPVAAVDGTRPVGPINGCGANTATLHFDVDAPAPPGPAGAQTLWSATLAVGRAKGFKSCIAAGSDLASAGTGSLTGRSLGHRGRSCSVAEQMDSAYSGRLYLPVAQPLLPLFVGTDGLEVLLAGGPSAQTGEGSRGVVWGLCDRPVAGGAWPVVEPCVDLRRGPAHGTPADPDGFGEQSIAHVPVDRAGGQAAQRLHFPAGQSMSRRLRISVSMPSTLPSQTGRNRSEPVAVNRSEHLGHGRRVSVRGS